jgi:lincosamide nucleotidyltransferase A/C/D/E
MVNYPDPLGRCDADCSHPVGGLMELIDQPGARYLMIQDDAVRLLGEFDRAGIEVTVGGGWGVDALLGKQTRQHSDLDLWLPAADLAALLSALVGAGIDRIHPWPGDRPWNFVLHDGHRLRVDLHLYEALPDGSIHYGSVLDGHRFPVAAISCQGSIAGRPVRCEAPKWALRWHTGYPARDVDRHDVALLAEHFDLPLPDSFR